MEFIESVVNASGTTGLERPGSPVRTESPKTYRIDSTTLGRGLSIKKGFGPDDLRVVEDLRFRRQRLSGQFPVRAVGR